MMHAFEIHSLNSLPGDLSNKLVNNQKPLVTAQPYLAVMIILAKTVDPRN